MDKHRVIRDLSFSLPRHLWFGTVSHASGDENDALKRKIWFRRPTKTYAALTPRGKKETTEWIPGQCEGVESGHGEKKEKISI